MVHLDASVPSQEGLSVWLEVNMQYHLDKSGLIQLLKTVGTDFEEEFIQPVLRSVLREVTCSREAKALYTTSERAKMHEELMYQLKERLEKHGIMIHDVLLSKIQLPENLTIAIERKLQMEQESQRMQFVLKSEEQEAKRKAIEAQGIKQFQEIVSADVNENLLRWKALEATEALAKSPNAKVLVIGAGKDRLPVLLSH